ncbi:MAG: DNA primase [Lachnospiraceae bacterium]|nr:DNA primase [Lachnospiraceae bacterium]
MFYPEEIIQEVRDRNDIVDVISQHVQLKKQGSNYFGLCPFHNEKSPSFSVSPGKKMFHCFGCHAGGNVITFVRMYENYSFQEAIKVLADRAGIKLPEAEMTEEMKKKAARRQRLYEINKTAATYFFYRLRNKGGEHGLEYFKKRELSEETMQKFGLGYALQYSDDLVKYLKSKDYDDELIREAGLGVFDEKDGMRDRFINRVMFPIFDANNKVIGFGGRVLGDAKPKYLNTQEMPIFEKRKNLYGLNFARSSRSNNFILCEGYMDVISMHQAGFTQAMASLGTAFTPEQALVLKRFSRDVLLAYDSDGAGVSATLKALKILRDAGINGRVISLAPYKDPDEFIKGEGREAFEERIKNAGNGFMFEIKVLRDGFDLSDPAQKTEFYREAAGKLLEFDEELERDNYLHAVCEEYRIPEDGLKKLLFAEATKKGLKRERAEVNVEFTEPVAKSGDDDPEGYAQRLLLTWLSEEPEKYNKIKDLISVEDFVDPLYRKVAGSMLEQLKSGDTDPAAIMDLFDKIEEQQRVSEIFHTRLAALKTDEEKEKAFYDIVVRVKEDGLKNSMLSAGKGADGIKKMVENKKILENLRRAGRI